jgi:hypothetical protein
MFKNSTYICVSVFWVASGGHLPSVLAHQSHCYSLFDRSKLIEYCSIKAR